MANRKTTKPENPHSESPLDFKKHGDGVNDPRLALEKPRAVAG